MPTRSKKLKKKKNLKKQTGQLGKTAARGSFKKKQNYRLVKTILNRERWGSFLKNAKKGVFWRKEGVKTGFYPVKNGKNRISCLQAGNRTLLNLKKDSAQNLIGKEKKKN